jgi:hypothetical protein
MVTRERALGRLFDFTAMQAPDDLVGGANTGLRVHMKHCTGITFFVYKATDGGTTDDFALDLQEHTASTGGTSADLDIITDYFTKSETTLDGDETWVHTTQTAASEITAIAGTAELQMMLVVEVLASDLSDGYEWVSINTPDLGSTDVQNTSIVAIPWGLFAERKPENLPDWLT